MSGEEILALFRKMVGEPAASPEGNVYPASKVEAFLARIEYQLDLDAADATFEKLQRKQSEFAEPRLLVADAIVRALAGLGHFDNQALIHWGIRGGWDDRPRLAGMVRRDWLERVLVRKPGRRPGSGVRQADIGYALKEVYAALENGQYTSLNQALEAFIAAGQFGVGKDLKRQIKKHELYRARAPALRLRGARVTKTQPE